MAHIWHLVRRPAGEVVEADFELRPVPDLPLAEGEVRIRNNWLSVDPYIRGLLDDEGSYMPTLPLGSPMPGGAVGTVIESRCTALPTGTQVLHDQGWRDLATLPAGECIPLDTGEVPAQSFLGHLGMPGQTAYFGLLDVTSPEAGECLFVSAAAGAVGTAVVQIGKLKGLRVIASAAGPDKCALLKKLGADGVIDRKASGTMREKLAFAAPDGIDIYFDNVGGDHLDAAIESARTGARIALCGMVSGYENGNILTLPDPMRLVVKQINLRGFIAPQFDSRRAEFQTDMRAWISAGQLQSPETVADGLSQVSAAFVDVLHGRHMGKMLVRL